MKTSYYTGYKDLDDQLARLYEIQARLEAEKRDTIHVIKQQDRLIEQGKLREKRIEGK